MPPVAEAAETVADDLCAMVQPFAETAFAAHREAGRPIVLATTTPYDLVKPFADRLGLDDVVATRYGVSADGTYDGTLDGPFVWSAGKLAAISEWAERHDVDLAESYAYSDSVYDTPMLAAVGHPIVVNPDPADGARRRSAALADAQPRRVARRAQDPRHRPRTAAGRASIRSAVRLPVRPLRHRRRRAHSVERGGDPRRQPSQLLRRRRHVADDRRVGSPGSLPRQEGGVRRTDRRADRRGDGRDPRRPGDRVRRAARPLLRQRSTAARW